MRHINEAIKEGLRHLSLDLVYQSWRHLLTQYHMDVPCWQPNDIEFIMQITSPDIVTEQILEKIVSFRRQFSAFTYELLGFTHEDVDNIFGWSRAKYVNVNGWASTYPMDPNVDPPHSSPPIPNEITSAMIDTSWPI